MRKINEYLAAARQRKAALLPQITHLALEGFSCREIGEKLGLSKMTVSHWLQGPQQETATLQSPGTLRTVARFAQRYESIYRNAIREWRRSRADKRVRVVVKSDEAGDGGGAKKKRTLRVETRTADPMYLTKAIEALKAFDDLIHRRAAPHAAVANFAGGPIPLGALTPDDLESMNDEQLSALDAQCLAENGLGRAPTQPPVLSDEDLQNMSAEQLRALDAQCLAEIERAGKAPRAS